MQHHYGPQWVKTIVVLNQDQQFRNKQKNIVERNKQKFDYILILQQAAFKMFDFTV